MKAKLRNSRLPAWRRRWRNEHRARNVGRGPGPCRRPQDRHGRDPVRPARRARPADRRRLPARAGPERRQAGRTGRSTLVVEDDELKPDVALLKAKSLVERDEVDIVVGTVFSNMLQAIFKPVVQSETFLISPNAGPSTFAGQELQPVFLRHVLPEQPERRSQRHDRQRGRLRERRSLMVPNYQAGRDNARRLQADLRRAALVGRGLHPARPPGLLGRAGAGLHGGRRRALRLHARRHGRAPGQPVRCGGPQATAWRFTSVFTTDETTLPRPEGRRRSASCPRAPGRRTWTTPPIRPSSPPSRRSTATFRAPTPCPGLRRGQPDRQRPREKTGGDLSATRMRCARRSRPRTSTSVRGSFAFSNNHYPVQDFHLLEGGQARRRQVLDDGQAHDRHRLCRQLPRRVQACRKRRLALRVHSASGRVLPLRKADAVSFPDASADPVPERAPVRRAAVPDRGRADAGLRRHGVHQPRPRRAVHGRAPIWCLRLPAAHRELPRGGGAGAWPTALVLRPPAGAFCFPAPLSNGTTSTQVLATFGIIIFLNELAKVIFGPATLADRTCRSSSPPRSS
jgi:branched-chain amino acid transport system substrate-binding protein